MIEKTSGQFVRWLILALHHTFYTICQVFENNFYLHNDDVYAIILLSKRV